MHRNAIGPKFEGNGDGGQMWARIPKRAFVKDGEERRMES